VVNGSVVRTVSNPGLTMYFDCVIASLGHEIVDISIQSWLGGVPGGESTTLVNHQNVTLPHTPTEVIAGANSVEKTQGYPTWSGSYTSEESYTGGCVLRVDVASLGKEMVLGLTSSAVSGTLQMEYGFLISATNEITVIEGTGSVTGTLGTAVVSTALEVNYIGDRIEYSIDATLVHTTLVASDLLLYLNGTFKDVGGKLDSIVLNDNGVVIIPPTVAGQMTPENVSTFIADAAIGAAQIGSLALTGVGNFNVETSPSGARMIMNSENIKVYDTNGIVRVKLGKLS